MYKFKLLVSVLLLLGVGFVFGDDSDTQSMSTNDVNGNLQQTIAPDLLPKYSAPVVLRDNVTFILYNEDNNADGGVRIYINKTETLKDFDPKKPTKVLVHGFGNNISSQIFKLLRSGYFDNGFDYNVIAVDYGVLSPGNNYILEKKNALLVGPFVGDLINFLVRHGAALCDIHLIGHSLGAHVVGMAGSSVAGGQRVARITGLDPAKPLFEFETNNHRLDATDAVIVDVIHTDGGVLGMLGPVGTIDFYPNGGKAIQPGCGLDLNGIPGSCSHHKSYEWYAESIGNSMMFPARSCDSLFAASSLWGLLCKTIPTGFMGEDLHDTPKGLYYLQTQS